jgi:hypothetical protein
MTAAAEADGCSPGEAKRLPLGVDQLEIAFDPD